MDINIDIYSQGAKLLQACLTYCIGAWNYKTRLISIHEFHINSISLCSAMPFTPFFLTLCFLYNCCSKCVPLSPSFSQNNSYSFSSGLKFKQRDALLLGGPQKATSVSWRRAHLSMRVLSLVYFWLLRNFVLAFVNILSHLQNSWLFISYFPIPTNKLDFFLLKEIFSSWVYPQAILLTFFFPTVYTFQESFID